jgi:hypothetical protein
MITEYKGEVYLPKTTAGSEYCRMRDVTHSVVHMLFSRPRRTTFRTEAEALRGWAVSESVENDYKLVPMHSVFLFTEVMQE